jgi:hypothetical protein
MYLFSVNLADGAQGWLAERSALLGMSGFLN